MSTPSSASLQEEAAAQASAAGQQLGSQAYPGDQRTRFQKFSDGVLSSWYGTTQFYAKNAAAITAALQQGSVYQKIAAHLSSGGTVDPAVMSSLYSHEYRIATVEAYSNNVLTQLTLVFTACAVPVVLAAAALWAVLRELHWFHLTWAHGLYFAFALGCSLLIPLAFMLFMSVTFAYGKLIFLGGCSLVLTLIFACLYVCVRVSAHAMPAFYRLTDLVAVDAGFWFCLFFMFCIALFAVQVILLYRWRDAHFPDSVIVHNLANLIVSTQENPGLWVALDGKEWMIRVVEETALCFETYLPKKLPCHDMNSAAWCETAFREIANTNREFVKWIALPKADTRDVFLATASAMLLHTANGDWDRLGRTPDAAVAARLSIGQRAVQLLKVLATACAVPAGGVVFHHMLPDQAIPGSILALLICWPVVIIVASLDPNINSKIDTFKNALSVFSSGSVSARK